MLSKAYSVRKASKPAHPMHMASLVLSVGFFDLPASLDISLVVVLALEVLGFLLAVASELLSHLRLPSLARET